MKCLPFLVLLVFGFVTLPTAHASFVALTSAGTLEYFHADGSTAAPPRSLQLAAGVTAAELGAVALVDCIASSAGPELLVMRNNNVILDNVGTDTWGIAIDVYATPTPGDSPLTLLGTTLLDTRVDILLPHRTGLSFEVADITNDGIDEIIVLTNTVNGRVQYYQVPTSLGTTQERIATQLASLIYPNNNMRPDRRAITVGDFSDTDGLELVTSRADGAYADSYIYDPGDDPVRIDYVSFSGPGTAIGLETDGAGLLYALFARNGTTPAYYRVVSDFGVGAGTPGDIVRFDTTSDLLDFVLVPTDTVP